MTDFILTLQFCFMFVFSSVGGVVANEAYLRLTRPNHKKWNNIMAKVILAIFVCAIVHGAYEYKKYEPKREWIVLLLAGFLHLPIGRYIGRDFVPMMGKWIVDVITKGGKNG